MDFNKQQTRVCQALAEAVGALCKNLLYFQSDITVEGLLGITVDKKNVILVNILEQVAGPGFGLEPEACEDIKELQGLGKSGVIVSRKETLMRVNGTGGDTDDKNDLEVKEEPAITQTSHDNSATSTMENGQSTCTSTFEAMTMDEGPRRKSLKYLGVRDALLPIEQELPMLEDIASHLPQQDGIDYNNCQITLSPVKNLSSEIFEKPGPDDFMSVKEETDSFTADLIDNCAAVLQGAGMLPDVHVLSDDDDDPGGAYSRKTDVKHTCDRCGHIFSHKRSLQRHQKKKHLGIDTVWRCEFCSNVFDRKDMLMRHMKTHPKTKELECIVCGKKFSRQDSMMRHVNLAHSSETIENILINGCDTGL